MDPRPNEDQRCRTCEHWGAPMATQWQGVRIFPCNYPLPFWLAGVLSDSTVSENGEACAAYSYSYRRARLVK